MKGRDCQIRLSLIQCYYSDTTYRMLQSKSKRMDKMCDAAAKKRKRQWLQSRLRKRYGQASRGTLQCRKDGTVTLQICAPATALKCRQRNPVGPRGGTGTQLSPETAVPCCKRLGQTGDQPPGPGARRGRPNQPDRCLKNTRPSSGKTHLRDSGKVGLQPGRSDLGVPFPSIQRSLKGAASGAKKNK